MFNYNHSTKTVTRKATLSKPYDESFPAIGFSQEDEGEVSEKDFRLQNQTLLNNGEWYNSSLGYDHLDQQNRRIVAIRIKYEPSLSAAVNIEGKEAEDYLGWAKMLNIVMDQMLEWKVNNTPSDVASLIKELYSKYQLFKSKP